MFMIGKENAKTWDEFISVRIPPKIDVDNGALIRMLEHPRGLSDVVLDTDTYNEIDDQFALAYLIKSDKQLNLKAIYAAPFYNLRSKNAKDGMEKSFEEIHKVLTLLDRQDLKEVVFHGSDCFLEDEHTPVVSDAAKDLIERAMGYSKDHPLYVLAIGAITNVASALLMKPEIRERIVVVWLGGNAVHWPHNREFNLFQDIAAGRVLFNSGVPIVQLPCMGVVSEFATSGPELNFHLKDKNKLCNYLLKITEEEVSNYHKDLHCVWTRIIWDVTVVGWMLEEGFMDSTLLHIPIPEYDDRYSFDQTRHFYRYVYHINRDALFQDLFKKLSECI